MILEFANNDYPGAQHYQAYGLRAAWLAVAQVPLIILLSGKRNLIGLLTGVNYQKLNVLHRWVARGFLVLATMHFGFQSTGWNEYGLMQLEWRTDTCPPTGIAAYVILFWMNIVNISPLRRLSYSFFIVQHMLMFFGLIIAIMMHLPTTALYSRIYIWIGIGLYIFDRLVRGVWLLWINKSMMKARLENLDGEATRVTVTGKAMKYWPPGGHVLLSFPKFSLCMTHPATIMSTPKSHGGDLVFLLKAHKGFTRSILESATKAQPTQLLEQGGSPPILDTNTNASYECVIDGPYRSSHLDLSLFEVAGFVAGGTGVTFTLATLLDLSDRVAAHRRVPKIIDFTWIIKRKAYIGWIRKELSFALQNLSSHGCSVTCKVYVTREHGNEIIKKLSKDSSFPCDDAGTEQLCLRSDDKMHSASKVDVTTHELRMIDVQYGRPDVSDMLLESIVKASVGETAIMACGSLELTKVVRNQYTRICDDRAVCKGTGAKGVYLYVENQSN